MRVPFLDLQAPYLELKSEIDDAVARVLASGWYILGEEVSDFEQSFAAYCDAEHCVGVANGLDALHLALRAMDVGPGDEVIVPSHTFIATWLAVSHTGALPVPVEPLESTFNIDASAIEAAITPRTKVILPVHLYGQPADLDPILEIARRFDLLVLEDAAQAHGARYKGQRIGSHGDAAIWSFYPGKNLGAVGDGGALTTNNETIAERVRMFRNYGSRTKYTNELQGFNSRLDPLQAAVLRKKLEYLDEWNARRSVVADRLIQELDGTGLILPSVPDWADPVWHLFVVRYPFRDALQQRLSDEGIGSLIHYPTPPHKQQAYADTPLAKCGFPIASSIADEVLSLPIGPHIAGTEVDQVVDALSRATSAIDSENRD